MCTVKFNVMLGSWGGKKWVKFAWRPGNGELYIIKKKKKKRCSLLGMAEVAKPAGGSVDSSFDYNGISGPKKW